MIYFEARSMAARIALSGPWVVLKVHPGTLAHCFMILTRMTCCRNNTLSFDTDNFGDIAPGRQFDKVLVEATQELPLSVLNRHADPAHPWPRHNDSAQL